MKYGKQHIRAKHEYTCKKASLPEDDVFFLGIVGKAMNTIVQHIDVHIVRYEIAVEESQTIVGIIQKQLSGASEMLPAACFRQKLPSYHAVS